MVIFDIQQVVGMEKEQGAYLLNQQGFCSRVTKQDGYPLVCTRDYRLDRVNFTLELGIITKVDIG